MIGKYNINSPLLVECGSKKSIMVGFLFTAYLEWELILLCTTLLYRAHINYTIVILCMNKKIILLNSCYVNSILVTNIFQN